MEGIPISSLVQECENKFRAVTADQYTDEPYQAQFHTEFGNFKEWAEKNNEKGTGGSSLEHHEKKGLIKQHLNSILSLLDQLESRLIGQGTVEEVTIYIHVQNLVKNLGTFSEERLR